MNLSIRNKITLLATFLITASILLTALPLYYRMVDALIDEEEKAIRNLSEIQGKQIEHYMYMLYQDMNIIQKNYEHAFSHIENGKPNLELVISNMQTLMLKNKHYQTIKIFSSKPPYRQQASLIADEFDLPIEEFEKFATGEMLRQVKSAISMPGDASISSLTRNDSSLSTDSINSSVFGLLKLNNDQGEVVAVLVVEVPFVQLLSQIHDVKSKYDYYYTNQKGEVLFSTDPETRDTLSLQQILYAEMLFPWASGLINSEQPSQRQLYFDSINNEERASYLVKIYYDIRDQEHYIGQIVTIPYRELIKSAISSRNWLLLFVAIMILLALFVSYFASRHIARPIEYLSEAIQEGAVDNNPNVTAIKNRRDEFGVLAGSLQEYVKYFNLQANEIRKNQAQLEGVLDNIMESVLVMSDKGIIKSVNKATLETFGYSYDEMINQPIEMIMPKEYQEYHQHFVERYLKSGNAAVMGTIRNIKALRKDGTEFDIELGINEVVLPDKHLFTGVIRDVSIQVEYEKNLIDAKRAAEENSMAKSHFLSMMSHEIRTPMNGILGIMQLLREQKDELSEEQYRYIETAYSSARNLLEILNGILDLSKIESGGFEIDKSEFDLLDELEDLTRLYYQSASDKGVELGLVVDPDMPRYVYADQLQIKQILGNLLNNAIKFTEEGGVIVSVAAKTLQSEKNKALFSFEVRDTGIGLSEEEQQKIFEPFVQAEAETTRRFGGTGLGLSIVQKQVENLGGEIKLKSTPGKGSSFKVSLPLEITKNETVSKHKINQSFLLIYRNRVAAEALQQQLGMLSAKVDQCLFSDFNDYMPKQNYDYLIVEDITALEHIQPRLQALGNTFNQIVLLTTGTSRTKQQGFKTDKTIIRPLFLSQLLLLSNDEQAKSAQAVIDQNRDQKRVESGHEENQMMSDKKILLVEDNQVNQMVATSILKKIGYNATVASNGQEAVDMLKAEPFDLVLMDCHMPVMDGYEATRAIRDLDGDVANIPIVAMTADAAMSDRDRCLSVGMNDHMAKPIEMMALKKMVEQWIL